MSVNLSIFQLILLMIGGTVLLYAVSWIAGSGFGHGFFRRKMRHNDEFLNKLESRSINDGTEEQEREKR